MTTSFRQESAKIYEFRAKIPAIVRQHGDESKPAADLRAPRAPDIVFGSGWYHEAAVQDAERGRKP